MRWLATIIVVWFSNLALAQSANSYIGSTLGLDLTWDTPNTDTANGGSIACSEASTGCTPINRALCDDTLGLEREIRATLLVGTAAITATANVYVWLQSETNSTEACTYSDTSSYTYLIGSPVAASDVLLVSSSLQFPDDYVSNLTLTIGEILNATGDLAETEGVVDNACTSSGLDRTYRLCFGVDTTGTTIGSLSDRAIGSYDPTAWLRIVIDTAPPADLTSVDVTALDNRLGLTPHASGTRDDDETWHARVRPLGESATASADDCSQWTDATASATTSAGNSSLEIATANGSAYEGCVYLVDQVGNRSSNWQSFTGTPFDQCDFIECYPGTPPSGCQTMPVTVWTAGVVVPLLYALRRIRIRR